MSQGPAKGTLAYAPIEDSDQPAYPCSLIRVFDVCSMGSQGSNVSSDERLTLISDQTAPSAGMRRLQ